jgi:hypothetical protein
MFRYLPWKRTGFTDISQDFPTIMTIRLCYYTGIVSSMIQIIGSSIILINNDDSSIDKLQSELLLAFSLLSTIYSIVMLMISYDTLRKVENKIILLLEKVEENKEIVIDEMDIDIDQQMPSIKYDLSIYDVTIVENIDMVKDAMRNIIVVEMIKETLADVNNIMESAMNPLVSESNTKNTAKQFQTSMVFADETVDMLRKQIKALGDIPVEYMTLLQIRISSFN